MKFEIGDKVLVLHSGEEGEVIDVINNKMVMVEVRGVKFPAYIDQLDFPYFKRFTEKKLFPAKKDKKYIEDLRKENAPKEKIIEGVWLSFLPKFETDEFGDDIVDELKIHLINRTERVYNFTYKLFYLGKPGFELKAVIQPFEDFYLHNIAFATVNDSPQFSFEFSLPLPEKGKAAWHEVSLKIKPKQIFDRIEKLKEAGEATFTYKLFHTYPDQQEEAPLHFDSLISKGIKVYNAKEARQHLPPARTVVDLHIEKLTNDWHHLSNAELLDIQLRAFEKWYDLALAHRQAQLTVIHGVGKGVLRDEIHAILRLKKEVKSYVNQYSASYGHGATEIYFQY